ncbi:MAG: CHASE3 domain-containing protein [Ginsengibacter sp.]
MLTSIVDKIADRVRWGYLTAFILLLTSYILTFYTTQQLLKQANWLNHTNNIINNLDLLHSTVKDGESALRGYVAIKNEIFLDGYHNSIPIKDSLFKTLASLMKDNNLQLKRMDNLKRLINEKYFLLDKGKTMFKENNYQVTDSLKDVAYQGKKVMDSVRQLMLRMQDAENKLMSSRSGRLSSFSNFMKIINISSLIVAILLTLYSIVTFTKENIAKKQADQNAKVFREQLEMRINELATVNKELVELRAMEKFAVTGRISRTIAHEIRNPLTNISLAAEHLRLEIPANAETDLLLEMITRNTNRINHMISELLNTTKITELDFTKVSLNDVLDASLEVGRDRLELKRIKVIKNYTPDLCDIFADVEKLKIAFLNIIVNAVEAMDTDKGILRIKTQNRDNRCVAIITDNGKGMNKEHLSKLFEPYFTTKEKGTGLGLANVQNIIISHKANILAESEENKGSSFTISLNKA